MDRMDDVSNKLDALFAEYRSACPDMDGSANFMPQMWQQIEARRVVNVSIFRRFAQACVMATVALTLLMAAVLPRLQREPVYNASYIDVLDAAQSSAAADLIASEIR
jgi:hypothetical protein